jgi:Ran GTPase-activating protein (RanGAP) involved in mRNA processing and transport
MPITAATHGASVALETLGGLLTKLQLAGNEIGPEGAKAIGEWLRDNRSLKVLWLGGNKIGPEGAKALADALRVNRSLTRLGVKNCGLDDESEALLRDAVKDKSGFGLYGDFS